MSGFSSTFHPLRIGYEVWAQVTAIELHSFDNFERSLHRLRLFNGDHAVFTDLVHRFCNDVADRLVAVCGNGADLCDRITLDGLREALISSVALDSLVDAALESHWVRACCNRFHAFAEDRLGQDGRGGRAVAGVEVFEATSRTICAPMFSSESFNSISFATVTPSLVIVGEPNFVDNDVAAFGPRVIFTASAS